jgi:hypothetical protein
VNGIGLMSIALLSVGSLLLMGFATGNLLLVGLALPFFVAGTVGLLDDLVLEERLTKKLLGLK